MSPHSSQTGREIILQCQEKAPTTVFSLLNKSCETSRIFIDKSTDRQVDHPHSPVLVPAAGAPGAAAGAGRDLAVPALLRGGRHPALPLPGRLLMDAGRGIQLSTNLREVPREGPYQGLLLVESTYYHSHI